MNVQQSQTNWSMERSADILKILGHPVRLKIVESILAHQPSNVSNIQKSIGIPRSTLSNHLSILKDGEIVRRERKANQIYYHVSCEFSLKIVAAAFQTATN